jgi:peptidoglycan hydrolase-like protein with peptidoglycan-binding domain
VRTGWAGALLAAALVLPACGAVPTASTTGAATQPAAAPTSAEAGTAADPSPSTSATTKPATKHKTLKATKPAKPKKPKKQVFVVAKGAKGERVRELQARLRQLDWYAGTITGTYGSSTVKAVSGFQGKRGLKKTGNVDAKTWAQLKKRTRTPTKDERHNVLRPGPAIYRQGSNGEKVRELQARLKQIAWFSGPVTGRYGSATASVPISAGASRAVKSDAPNSAYIAAVR